MVLFKWITVLAVTLIGLGPAAAAIAADEAKPSLHILDVRPTPLFPKAASGQPLMQLAELVLRNDGEAFSAEVRLTLGDGPSVTKSLGQIAGGKSTKQIHVPDISAPEKLRLELLGKGDAPPLASRELTWQPQKKWTIYYVAYSHQDLGFGNLPHRLRTDNRHANIDLSLEFCRQTDEWDFDDRFRFVHEGSEALTSYLGSRGPSVAAELARRIREGRIQIGGLHGTVNSEQLSHEGLARLFYLTNRHGRDLLNIPSSKTAQIDDVIGLTWPLATLCDAAGVPYFFHGFNMGCLPCLRPAWQEPAFYWQGPDERSKVLVRSTPYGHGEVPGETHFRNLIAAAVKAGWPYKVFLLGDGSDFQPAKIEPARKIREWNARYAYPHAICATMDMFFDALMAEADPAKIRTFSGDANNEWASIDSADAPLLSQARRAGEMIPTAEKFATFASVLTPGGYPWTDIYQAYHRLLTYHEHTDGPFLGEIPGLVKPYYSIGQPEAAVHYETEIEENREMGREAELFGQRALDASLDRLAAAISTTSKETLAVFNPLGRSRKDLVRVDAGELPERFRLVDSVTGKEVPHQRLDADFVFVAEQVPALGYKTFSVEPAARTDAAHPSSEASATDVLENRFYRLEFDASGTIASLRDKELDVELIDASAPHKFNEYLYEYYPEDRQDGNQWHRPKQAQLARSSGPVAQVMTVDLVAQGASNIRQQVILYRDLKRIDFLLSLDKSPSGMTLAEYSRGTMRGKEALYAAMPFAIPDFSIHHELPGAIVEPIRQQFDGSCTAHYAVRHFSDISNDKFGVTVSALDSSLVEYGHPRSCPMQIMQWSQFDRELVYPAHSRLYLYLLNNMWSMNLRIDQQGPMVFRWSLRSHAGNWKVGQADQFGWDVHNPLLARVIRGRRQGALPANESSFVSVEPVNVVCTTIKPAEANGPGLILRFVETAGTASQANVHLPFLGSIASANETSLVEDDRPIPLEVKDRSRIGFAMAPFGVKTIRVLTKPPEGDALDVNHLRASARSDMEVDLSWRVDPAAAGRISHYEVYRGDTPDFQPTLLNLVQRPARISCTDRPQLHFGGWINNRLEPETRYYYRVAAVDRGNHRGPLSAAVAVKTLKPSEKNALPRTVEALSAIGVSDVAPVNWLSLLWRTNCESDIAAYHVHRSTTSGFTPDESNRIAVVDARGIIEGSDAYGHTPVDRGRQEFDHQTYLDREIEPSTTYYYQVCAVDAAGQRGPYSAEAAARGNDAAQKSP